MLTLANINSLNWFTARSKEHYQLTLAERNSHFQNHTTTQLLNEQCSYVPNLTQSKEHYLLTLANRNSLNWFTTSSKEH